MDSVTSHYLIAMTDLSAELKVRYFYGISIVLGRTFWRWVNHVASVTSYFGFFSCCTNIFFMRGNW